MLGSLEFVGAHERTDWKLAERLTPITHIAWSLLVVANRALRGALSRGAPGVHACA
ncbi:MAG TPA: hypothetical protein VFZ00_08590 [Solirubrobacter sp.]|nr:hypothetical protein [Solirubrobacter sp.]